MKIVVFDDWRSLIHFFVGGASLFLPFLLPVFISYELVETIIKREEKEYFLGDMIEFLTGAGSTALAMRLLLPI